MRRNIKLNDGAEIASHIQNRMSEVIADHVNWFLQSHDGHNSEVGPKTTPAPLLLVVACKTCDTATAFTLETTETDDLARRMRVIRKGQQPLEN